MPSRDKNYLEWRTKLKLKQVINAAGKMTSLGGSILSPAIANMIFKATQDYVVISELTSHAARIIAAHFKAPAAHITSSASAAIQQVIAGLIHQGRKKYIFSPIVAVMNDHLPREVIIPKGHNINYGTKIETIIELGGGQIVEAGSANMCHQHDVEALISPSTIALMYVKSHHCVQKSMLSFKTMMQIAQQYDLPMIIDIAAEEDPARYIKEHPDIIIWSGSKAMAGPAAGIIVGKQKLINWIKAETLGMGRVAKIDKSLLFGTIVAFDNYFKQPPTNYQSIYQYLMVHLNNIPAIEAHLVDDEAGRNFQRIRVKMNDNSQLSAASLVAKLQENEPQIFTRDYHQHLGHIDLDVRMFKAGDKECLINKFRQILK